MLTVEQAIGIVTECIYQLTGVASEDTSQRLFSFGIDSPEKLNLLKLMIVKDVAYKYGESFPLGDLRFDQGDTLGTVYSLLLRGPAVARYPMEPPAGGMAAPRTGTKQKRKVPKKAAKKPLKRVPKKAKGGRHLSGKAAGGRGDTSAKKGPKRAKGSGIRGRKTAIKDETARIHEHVDLGSDEAALMIREDRGSFEESGGGEGDGPGGPGGPGIPLSPTSIPSRTVEAVPQMEIRSELNPKKNYLLSVFVNQEAAAVGAEVDRVVAEIPTDWHEFELDVWLDCSSHFHLDGVTNSPRIKVNADTGVSDELTFRLTVVKDSDESPMYVSAFFRYNGRPSGKITRYLEWAGSTLRWKKTFFRRETKGEVVLPKADAPPAVVLEIQGIPADIRVEVLTKTNNGQNFGMKCFTPQGKWEGDWNLPAVSKDLVNTYMKNFMADVGEARIASLEGAGMDFWDALPRDARELLWSALEKGAYTMSVISEEPYIPWELMIPYKELQHPRKPLGIELQIGRWITGNYQAARQRISLKSGYIICPKTSGLKGAAQEVTFLTQQLQPEFNPVDEVVPASFDRVNTQLAAGPRDVIHFMCHGKSAALQTLMLDTPDTLNCSQVRALKGFKAAFKRGPLAFLNACEVGGQVPALDGVGGFANSFIQMGASAVIAPLWAVQDSVALDVTKTFYPQALQGMPFASIMQEIRTKAYSQALDSYAAYCFYGDPMASLA